VGDALHGYRPIKERRPCQTVDVKIIVCFGAHPKKNASVAPAGMAQASFVAPALALTQLPVPFAHSLVITTPFVDLCTV
jgi:hypothetical protein